MNANFLSYKDKNYSISAEYLQKAKKYVLNFDKQLLKKENRCKKMEKIIFSFIYIIHGKIVHITVF